MPSINKRGRGYQATYRGPDGRERTRTFDLKKEADGSRFRLRPLRLRRGVGSTQQPARHPDCLRGEVLARPAP